MQKPTINRGSYLNFYHAENFSLSIPKKDKNADSFLTFVVGNPEGSNYQFSTVLVDRRQAAYALKNFKKVIDKARKLA